MATFGERLKELRQGAGLTQEALAAAAGVPVFNVRNWEQNHREPRWDAFCKLTTALGACCKDFADVEGVAESPEAKKGREVRAAGLPTSKEVRAPMNYRGMNLKVLEALSFTQSRSEAEVSRRSGVTDAGRPGRLRDKLLRMQREGDAEETSPGTWRRLR